MTPTEVINFTKGLKSCYILDRNCPRCGCVLFIQAIDSVWCIRPECSYGELHLVGNGTQDLKPIARLIKH